MMAAWLTRFWGVLDYIFCYVTVKLGRGVFFSVVLVFVVMLLRKLPLFRHCFQRMILWSFFLWLPFTGGLKLFYETRFGVRGFLWWADWNYQHQLIGKIYFLTMALYGGYLFYRRRKLQRFVRGLGRLWGNVYVCDSMVTPFATGLLSPKIVVPAGMVEACGREELDTIVFHEKMHIRLGHLWCLFLWDVLRVLFWPNFLLTFCMRALKADLEEMCDRVTIQRSGRDAFDYGMLLLKCVRLLGPAGAGKAGVLPAESAAFAGEAGKDGRRELKCRIRKIAEFRRYRMINIFFIFFIGLVLVGGGFFAIHSNSYARYTDLEDITVFDDTGCNVILPDSERLRRAVSFDDRMVYVDAREMQDMLEECGAKTEGIYVLFGGFMKQPGVGGCCDMVYVDCSELECAEGRAKIEYETSMDLLEWIMKMV